MVLPVFFILGILACTAILQAQDSYHYRIENEWVAIDQASFAPLVYGEKLRRPAKNLRKDVLNLVVQKKAEVVKRANYISIMKGPSGVRDVTQLLYPTDYKPMRHTPEKWSAEGKVLEPARHSLPVPLAFEQKPIGVIVRSESKQTEEETFTIKLAAEWIRKHPNKIFNSYTYEGKTYHIQWPQITSSKAFTNIKVEEDKPVLVSMHVPYSSEGERLDTKRVIHFLKLKKVFSK